jgi:hypothetical protein
VNLASPFTYHLYVGCLIKIRSTIRSWQKASLFVLLESVYRIRSTEIFSVGSDESFRETIVSNV